MRTNYSRRERAQQAIDVQNACNPTGVSALLQRIGASCINEGLGTDGAKTDPGFLLTVFKICDLCGIEYNADAYGAIYWQCVDAAEKRDHQTQK